MANKLLPSLLTLVGGFTFCMILFLRWDADFTNFSHDPTLQIGAIFLVIFLSGMFWFMAIRMKEKD